MIDQEVVTVRLLGLRKSSSTGKRSLVILSACLTLALLHQPDNRYITSSQTRRPEVREARTFTEAYPDHDLALFSWLQPRSLQTPQSARSDCLQPFPLAQATHSCRINTRHFIAPLDSEVRLAMAEGPPCGDARTTGAPNIGAICSGMS